MAKKIGIIVGSLRKDSWNRKVALALIKLAPASLAMELIEINELPLYNQDPDDEGTPFKQWEEFRAKVNEVDGVLFVTPEYNRSIPAPLKNAIDVGSRPYGQSVWANKPGAVISVSPSAIGGFGANQHLRQTFVFLDIFCMQQPEAYIGNIQNLYNSETNEFSDKTTDFLKNVINSFADWVGRFND